MRDIILLESMSGLKFCPDWPKFHEMLKGATLKAVVGGEAIGEEIKRYDLG